MTPRPPAASVVIPTRNRCKILRDSLLAATRQTVPVELIVLDDGSSDGTGDMIRLEFPQAIYQYFGDGPHGPAYLRNRGSEMANAAFLFPIDDDAVMVSPNTVAQTLAEFDHPRIGAVGIPFINVRIEQHVRQLAPDENQIWVEHTFTGASHAIRRTAFLGVGRYREHFFYMGEEGDLTLRMLAAGWVTRSGRADAIEHHESPLRVTSRADFCGRRNDVLFAVHNVPGVDLPIHLLGTVVNGLRAAAHSKHPFYQCCGLASGLWQGLCQWIGGKRQPVSRNTYRLHRRLKKGGALPLSSIELALPPLKPQS